MTFSLQTLGKYKYILLLLLCALVLLLLPGGGGDGNTGEASEIETRLEYVLSGIDGAGPVSYTHLTAGADLFARRLELDG